MEFSIIILVIVILGIFIWRGYANNKKQSPKDGGNPNPNAPTESRRL